MAESEHPGELNFSVSKETAGALLQVRSFRGLRFRDEPAPAGDHSSVRCVRHGDSRLLLAVTPGKKHHFLHLAMQSGAPSALFDTALRLLGRFELHRIHPDPGPARRCGGMTAQRVLLDPGAGAGEAFRVIMGASLGHLFANHAAVLAGHPGGVHQTRVALRRIRAGLGAFRELLPTQQRELFNDEFRWLQRRLAWARDWHVLLDETVPRIAADSALGAGDLRRLRRVAREECTQATASAVRNLGSHPYTRLILLFERWLAGLEDEVPPRRYRRRLLPFAAAVCTRARQDLLDEERPLSRLPGRDLHALRKQAKHARYAYEFFASLWDADRVEPYLDLMEALQDRFGASNDAAIVPRLLWQVTPDRLDPELARRLAAWSELRVRSLVREAGPYWRRFRARPPFWD